MQKRHLLHITYFFTFFFALHSFAVLYVNSSVLARAVGEKAVGLVYVLAAVLAIAALAVMPTMLRNIGDRRFTLFSVLVAAAATFGLAMTGNPVLIVLLFVIHSVIYRLILMDVDVFLESATSEDETGVVRGTFLTIANIALVIAPILVGLLLGKGEEYARVYLFASFVFLPAALLLFFSFKRFKDPSYVRAPLLSTWKKIQANPALRRITKIDWLLRFFYAWMVIYMPLYLHSYIGLPWERIGVIFTIMLIPFALFELPLGALADRVYGEKELLIAGLFIMGASTLVLSFITSTSFLVWAIALFCTRLGAAAVEIMSETYFFKHVHPDEADIISFFRSVEPFAYAIAPLLASLMLLFVPLSLLFVVLGFLILAGIPVALKLVDTR